VIRVKADYKIINKWAGSIPIQDTSGVHNVFGVVLVASGLGHLFLNRAAISNNWKENHVLITGVILEIALVAGYVAGAQR
jgi:hypothetical protein